LTSQIGKLISLTGKDKRRTKIRRPQLERRQSLASLYKDQLRQPKTSKENETKGSEGGSSTSSKELKNQLKFERR
jgi:hypothetical protein